ncbi:MAG: ion transporter [Planctomycetes bacterium]|nr:ion transporter [Planctomycetota bacterium]
MAGGGQERGAEGWRARYYRIIFEADTPAGKAFDVILIAAILLSILTVMLESITTVRERHGELLRVAEWAFTILFTIEYALRLMCTERPLRYARSFFGLVDLLSIIPTYASVLVPGAQALLVIRTLRILRVFRVLKLAHYVRESETLLRALVASRRKISVFIFAVFTLVVVFGSLMYLIEGPDSGFTSIPRGVYWAVVTLTTVGYGDIAPQTNLGQAVAAVIMVLGYGIIAVPTGIITAELTQGGDRSLSARACRSCDATRHDADALHCKRCGARLT